MKKLLLIIVCALSLLSCESEEENLISDVSCGTYDGNTLYRGPEGGCYYFNSNDNKTYVDWSECNC